MELELIQHIDAETWDRAIAPYDSKFLFHQSAWLNFLKETQGGEILRFRIRDNGREEGYFAGLLVRKGPLTIFGSPLRGWTTDYMGPIVNRGFDYEKFLPALEGLCRTLKIDHLELCNPLLDDACMQRAGFTLAEGITYVVPLHPSEEEMWKQLEKKSCQYSIRKAKKDGLVIEEHYGGGFVDEYYRQLGEVFAKQGLVPTYPVERVRSLLKHLAPKNIVALQVKYGDKAVASGIFPYDDRQVYFFGGASWQAFHKFCPNELLHWTIMTRSAGLGISRYDMCGSGSFKPKFGGQKVAVKRYSKSYSLLARVGREAYRSFFYARQRIKGSCQAAIRRWQPAEQDD
jgi:hypothetical protein